MRFILFACFATVLVGTPAWAAGGEKNDKSKAENHRVANWAKEEKKGPAKVADTKKAGQAVDLPVVVLPISDQGKLTNYAYVLVRINLADGQDAWLLRSKSHFLKDAIIRKSHRVKLVIPQAVDQSTTGIDPEQLTDLIYLAIEPWVAKNLIKSIEFLKVDLQG